jgi:tripartite-type tricarboxylate transporter receptor subunit TctC
MKSTCLVALALSLGTFGAQAQTYPSKPVKIVVGFAPGGGSDFAARVIAQQLTDRMKNQVIVENKPGAGSLLGAEYVIKSAPDGYTLLLTPASYTVNPSVYKLSFDPLNDITPIAQISKGPYIVAVHPSVPAKTLKELIDYA